MEFFSSGGLVLETPPLVLHYEERVQKRKLNKESLHM